MENQIEYTDERRGGGTHTSRFGSFYGQSFQGGPGTRIGRRFQSPQEQAGTRLVNILQDFPNTTKEFANRIRDEYITMPQFTTMNMETFAATIYLLEVLADGDDVTPEFFNQHVDSVLFRLDPGVGTEGRDVILQKHRESILRYLRAIQIYRSNGY